MPFLFKHANQLSPYKERAHIGGAGFVKLALCGAMFAEFSRKHVRALREHMLQDRRVTLCRLFFLKPQTRETEDVTCVARGARARLATVGPFDKFQEAVCHLVHGHRASMDSSPCHLGYSDVPPPPCGRLNPAEWTSRKLNCFKFCLSHPGKGCFARMRLTHNQVHLPSGHLPAALS